MNWSRAKTILIFMFLATAILQSVAIYNSDKKAKNIPPEIIASSVEILSANEIYVARDIIPTTNYTLASADADNAVFDYTEFAKRILGDDCIKVSETQFYSTLGTLNYFANSFEFTSSNTNATIPKNELSAESAAKEFLKRLDIKPDTKPQIIKRDSSYELKYTNSVEAFPVFNSEITLSLGEGEVTSAKGNWFNVTEKTGSHNLKSITAVLIDLIKEELEKPVKITNISIGYIIPESSKYQKSASLVPVWRIEFENGKRLMLDARSPE